jgi:hypothetical protein
MASEIPKGRDKPWNQVALGESVEGERAAQQVRKRIKIRKRAKTQTKSKTMKKYG